MLTAKVEVPTLTISSASCTILHYILSLEYSTFSKSRMVSVPKHPVFRACFSLVEVSIVQYNPL